MYCTSGCDVCPFRPSYCSARPKDRLKCFVGDSIPWHICPVHCCMHRCSSLYKSQLVRANETKEWLYLRHFPVSGKVLMVAGCCQGSVVLIAALSVLTSGLVTPGLATLPGYSQQVPFRASTPHSQMHKPKLICNFN